MKSPYDLADVHHRTLEACDLLLVKEEILVEESECEMREGARHIYSALFVWAEQLGLPSLEPRSGISLANLLGQSNARFANALSCSVRFIIALRMDPRLVTS